MKSKINILSLSIILAIATYSGSANADKGGKHHDKHGYEGYDNGSGKHKKQKHHKSDNDDDYDDDRHSYGISFGDGNRVVIREYLVREYAPNCPPGLAKKHNGCLPPGIAKKRYVIGQPLHGEWRPVPHDLLLVLEPAPIGYQYVEVDKDVLLISEASKKVIDAVTLLSAVGH
jgi:Ni/Co efflux regulator RcnB